MAKKRRIDFVLKEDKDEKIIFRFYPRQSFCHSFGDGPPKSWDEVYKVYYHYKILRFWKDDDGTIEKDYDVLFRSGCDECSIIDVVGNICLSLADGVETYKDENNKETQLLNQEIFPCGMGVSWTIFKHTFENDELPQYTSYKFMLFDYSGKGFRFWLDEENIKSFGNFLLECCEYMLNNGDPI